MTLRRALLMLLVAPVVLAAVAWFWLLHTESGARWLWARAEAATGGALTVAGLRGDISSGVELLGIRFVNDAVELGVDDVSLAAGLEVLPLRVIVKRADSSGFSLRKLERNRRVVASMRHEYGHRRAGGAELRFQALRQGQVGGQREDACQRLRMTQPRVQHHCAAL